jgi:mRNA-degrading endonuclease RelE of RelBE toxin-antitoxin system
MEMFRVAIKKKVERGVGDLPERIQDKFWVLAKELRLLGPIRSNWPNFSKLGSTTYHCHLSNEWVACWRWEKATINIEVYYAGSREDAPY